MDSAQVLNAVQHCEDILRETQKSNLESRIWPSENVIIDRMLERRLELKDVYEELHRGLGEIPFGIWTFLDSVLGVAMLWHPEAISEQRASRQRLVELNSLIANVAENLADLINERSEISNDSGFSTDCHYHICDLVEEAASSRHLFNSWLKEPIQELTGQFGLKYWPNLSEVVRVLAVDARRATVEASDTITKAATSAKRPSKSDFVRALYVALDDRSERNRDKLPIDFKLTDGAMASLVNCLLDLGAEEVVDGIYVKGFRQRARVAEQSSS